jgi:hypothetical protein
VVSIVTFSLRRARVACFTFSASLRPPSCSIFACVELSKSFVPKRFTPMLPAPVASLICYQRPCLSRLELSTSKSRCVRRTQTNFASQMLLAEFNLSFSYSNRTIL